MVDKDVVYAKIGIIKRCLNRIAGVTKLNPELLEQMDVQDVFVLNLERASQAAIDLAAHVVASEGLGVPQDLKENFSLLKESGIIPSQAAEQMKKMVGFRNMAVHEYHNLDVKILKSILKNNLRDLEDFYGEIVKHFRL